ncbi:MAG: hypothetical protein HC798_01480 [Polaribacter sp.]|nr:hypothetical protein [Polaribacter sp.]
MKNVTEKERAARAKAIRDAHKKEIQDDINAKKQAALEASIKSQQQTEDFARNGAIIIMIVIGLIVFFLGKAFVNSVLSDMPTIDDMKGTDDYKQMQFCNKGQSVVKSKLKAPSTASFKSCSSSRIHGSNDNYSMSGYVDAENGFGAKIRAHYVCEGSSTSATCTLL